jgi:hypothetical protein
MEEVGNDSVNEQFAQLDAEQDEQEVASRLAQLKSGASSRVAMRE